MLIASLTCQRECWVVPACFCKEPEVSSWSTLLDMYVRSRARGSLCTTQGSSAPLSTLTAFLYLVTQCNSKTIEAKLSGRERDPLPCWNFTCTISYLYTRFMSTSQNHNPMSTVIQASRSVFW